jgi:hypothetical protein
MDRLDRVSIAAPCSADWDSMPGTDRVRHCSQCNKNVYNLSAMTRRQAETLLRESEGRLCARLYRRADGSVITENCPVGLRAVGRRISRVVGAAMSAMMAFSSTASAQSPLIQINPAQTRQSTFSISGDVIDITGVAVPNAHVTLSHQGSAEKLVIQASDKGTFRLDYLPRGYYTIQIDYPGFQSVTKHVSLGTVLEYRFRATMEILAIMGDIAPVVKRRHGG